MKKKNNIYGETVNGLQKIPTVVATSTIMLLKQLVLLHAKHVNIVLIQQQNLKYGKTVVIDQEVVNGLQIIQMDVVI